MAEELTPHEQSLLAIVRSERQRWNELRQYAAQRGDAGLSEAMDAASARYGERARATPPRIDPEYLLRQTELLDALWQIAWHTAQRVTLRIGGTHVNYSIVEAKGGKYEFLTDQQSEVDRLMAWADALRHRQADAPLPEPAPPA